MRGRSMHPSRILCSLVAAFVIAAATAPAIADDQGYSPVVAWGGLKVFARGDNGKLVSRSYDAEKKAWSKWEPLGEKELSSAPCALITPRDRLTVFFRGTDGKMYHIWQDKGKEWSGVLGHWDGELSSAPSAVVVGDLLTVLARSKDGKLMRTYYDGEKGAWTAWETLD